MAESVEDAFRYGKLVIATTTYNADIFPFMKHFILDLTERGYQNRTIGIIENGSWAPTAAKGMAALFEGCKELFSIGDIGGKGIGIKGLSASALKSIVIPFPPLAEQHRIVEKLELLLGKIDKLKK